MVSPSGSDRPSPIHPKDFKNKWKMSVYQMARESGYSVETISHWIASETSARKSNPSQGVCHHFGEIDKRLEKESVRLTA